MENIKNKQYQNIDKIEIEDIDDLINYLKNRNYEKIGNEEINELIKLYGITSYISLFLFKLYIDKFSDDDKFEHFIEEDPKKYYDTIFSLYKLSSLFSTIAQNYPDHKKLLVFSLFNIFNVNLIPEVNIYEHLQSLNVCFLNNKSILLSKSFEGTYLDIFDKNNGFIYSQNKRIIPIFDTNGNNLLINNEILFKIFSLLLSKYTNIIYEKNFSKLKKIIPQDPFVNVKQTIENESYFYSIIYYYNSQNYKILNNHSPAFDEFWRNNKDNYRALIGNNNRNKYFNFNSLNFSLQKYLTSFFFIKNNSHQVLLSFISDFDSRIEQQNDIEEELLSEMRILFNFIKIYFPNIININQGIKMLNLTNLEINSKNFNLNHDDLIECFNIIQRNDLSILVCILFLRALLPFILDVISDIVNVYLDIFYFDKERFFDSFTSSLNLVLNDEEKEIILEKYFKCLSKIISNFSFGWEDYSNAMKKNTSDTGNAVSYMIGKLYDCCLKNIDTKQINFKFKQSILERAYDKNYNELKIDYNWSFHFFEIIFHCFYLNFIDCLNILYEKGMKDSKIYHHISNFLDNYERSDYYFNFINKDGAYLNISRLLKYLLYKEKFKYKMFKEKYFVRKKLLKEHKYNFISKQFEYKINILTKKNNYGSEEIKGVKNEVYLDIKSKLSIFKNSYNNCNAYLRRFLYDGYEENKISIIDEYYTDITKIYEFKVDKPNYI